MIDHESHMPPHGDVLPHQHPHEPPIDLGVDSELPPPPPEGAHGAPHRRVEWHVHLSPDVRRTVGNVLDAVDRAAERVAKDLGLRPGAGGEP